MTRQNITTQHPACDRDYDHDAHYLGRDDLGHPQRCAGSYDDADYENTGWTGR